jgi:ABC-type multidrug transport system fused ATPase/permease subunit
MIWEVAELAHLTDFLKDLTLEKDVGERGDTLSGGQQQKVSILRGLLKTSRIMLLDEITASLDSKSATEAMKAMNEASQGMTTLAITHKLTEAQHADQIILLSEGKVLAQGTHAELFENCEAYKALWNAYTSKESKPAINNTI